MKSYKTPASLDSKFLRAIKECSTDLEGCAMLGEMAETLNLGRALVSLNRAYALYNDGFENRAYYGMEDGEPGWFMTKRDINKMARLVTKADVFADRSGSNRTARACASLLVIVERLANKAAGY